MSLLIDVTYARYVINRLTLGKQIRDRLWNAKCPICGDGKKSKSKRFYIYPSPDGDFLLTKCHNCSHSSSFYKFLEWFDEGGLFAQYRLELFKERGRAYKPPPEPKKEEELQVEEEVEEVTWLDEGVQLISELTEEHPARKYVEGRKIPSKHFSILGYTKNFRGSYGTFSPLVERMKVPDDERLIIPFLDETGQAKVLQGRALGDSQIRYMTLKKEESAKKLFGLDRLVANRSVLVVEGPIDSLFLPNCIATADANLLSAGIGDILIPDNQYRNKEVCGYIEKMIESGKQVVLYPEWYPFKDINDAFTKGGYTQTQIFELIAARRFSGLRAKLEFSRLRKC